MEWLDDETYIESGKRISSGWCVKQENKQLFAVQLFSHVWLFVTLCTAAHQVSLSFTISWSFHKFICWISDASQPSHPLSSPSPPAFSLCQHQSLFQWVNSSHEVAKVLEWGAIASSPGVCSNSCPLSWWCYLTSSSFATLFCFCLQSFPAWGSFPMSWLFVQGAKVVECQLQHQSFQWIFSVDFL